MNDPFLQKLIAFPSESHNREANNQILDYLADFLADHGLHVAHYNFKGIRSFVATTIKDSKTPKVMLGVHLDVAPAPEKLFNLREDEYNYYGRGVYDMKFAAACYMHIIDQIKDSLADYDLGIMATTDEEIGGQNGVKQLVEMGYWPGVCILPDGGQNWNIETMAKGLLAARIKLEGNAAHGSRPWEGDNPIFPLMSLLQEIQALFNNQHIGSNSFNLGAIHAGRIHNQVPSTAEALVDFRYLSNKDYSTISKKAADICAKYNASFIEEIHGLPFITDLNNPMVKPFTESIRKITGHTPAGTMSIGASDARFFAAAGIPCILTHPEGDGQHADNEWISKDGYQQFILVLRDYIDKMARI